MKWPSAATKDVAAEIEGKSSCAVQFVYTLVVFDQHIFTFSPVPFSVPKQTRNWRVESTKRLMDFIFFFQLRPLGGI